jgi:hypothetical protein
VFELADESLDEPPRVLEASVREAGLNLSCFKPWKIGAEMLLDNIT